MIKLKILLSAIIAGAGIVFCLTGCAADDENDVINDNLTTFTSAGIVLGQADFNTAASGTARSGMNQPSSAAISGTKLLVLDSVNHRILIWNTMPTENGQAADVVVGTGSAGTTQNTMSSPAGLCIAGTKLIVADTGNHRVLIWNTIPETDYANADQVLGQMDFISGSANRGGSATVGTLNNPSGVWSDGTYLMVADTGNNRVLVWETFPESHGAGATLVLGQSDFISTSPNRGGSAAGNTLNRPSGVWSNGTRIMVADVYNYRVLIWNTMPTANGVAADSVLGQSSMTTGTAGTSGTELKVVKGLFSLNGKIYVSDTGNNRIMIWNSIPATSGTAADIVIGQGDFTHSAYNDDDQDGAADLTPTARTLNQPMGLFYSNGTLLVADSGNNRLLIYK